MQFVVIGGDAAGMSAASRAKRHRPDMHVTVLEKTDDVSYSACGMPYNIADPDRDMDDLVVRRADVFREKQGIRLLTGCRAEVIDPHRGMVHGLDTNDRPVDIPYDRLLIATGAAAVRPEITGVAANGVLVLKHLADGRAIRHHLASRPVRRAVIVGMGYIALEMSEALAARGIAVDMVKPGPELLPWMDRPLAATVHETLAREGMGVHCGCDIQRIQRRGEELRVVCDDRVLPADLVLVAVGVTPNSGIAETAGIACGPAGAIAVDAQMRTSAAGIYAAGDCADAFHVVTGQRTWIPLALRANRTGWAAADHVCGKEVQLDGVVGTAVFKVFDLQVARTGLNAAEAAAAGFAPAAVSITSSSRAHAHPGASGIQVHVVGDRRSGRLLGMQMVGREGVAHRINAPAVALHAGMTVAEFAGSDLAYAPPFGPVWDPMLTAANQKKKKL